MTLRSSKQWMGAVFGALLAMPLVAQADAADALAPGVRNRTIGYVTADLHWALYQTPDGKQECPDGLDNYGPREMFKDKFPNGGPVADTQLKTEANIWFPQGRDDHSPYRFVKGPIALGLNLDGKVGPNDFTSPTGEKGIDNQLYRAIGCSPFFRGPTGNFYIFGSKFIQETNFNRTMIEITNVEDLRNSPNVDVTLYRGLDGLMTDATGDNVMAGGSERIDSRFGRKYERHFKGKIVNGVLTTEPADIYWPWSLAEASARTLPLLAARFSLNLTPGSANGYIGAYANVDDWYEHLRTFSTHHLSYGQLYAPALYRTLHELADGYPDKNGVNTAISLAMDVKMAQVFIIHPPQTTAAGEQKLAVQPETARH